VHESTSVVQARDLSGAHIGRIARLPGRRHPDGHVDHEFAPDEVVTLVGGDA
jgi:hypothetical protein